VTTAWNSGPVRLVRLGDGDLVLLLDTSGAVPSIVDVSGTGGLPDPARETGLPRLLERPRPPGSLDVEAPVSLVPTAASGFSGRPGLECHRHGGSLFPDLGDGRWSTEGPGLAFEAADRSAGVRIDGAIRVEDVAVVELTVTNTGPDDLFVDRLAPTIALPDDHDELLRFTGGWCREFQPTRVRWPAGAQLVESRRGRTSHDAVPVVFTGQAGFGEHRADVVGVHLAWSGNHEIRLDRLADGRRLVQAGEVLVAGEILLAPGERYSAPPVLLTAGRGLTACSQRFHRQVRRHLPVTPRPVLCNTWEAVYFDQDLDTLKALATRAASVGVERFVLDDGWFGSRRDDTAGLGDWWVSADVHPDGLGPLIDHVTGSGMDFGIWVEPEMVNRDSVLYRTHPDWVLGPDQITGRNQLVLDLAREACWTYLFDLLDRLLAGNDVAFVKWDMNRDLIGAGAHHQTLAVYRLIDALRRAHPGVEFESCASGGGRADAGILRRTARIWTSDTNDALERQIIQRGFSYLLPPEVMGAHVGPRRAHTTGRTHRLSFRAATAIFGHLGVEWNLLDASDRELDELRWWISLHKRLRPLLHTGDVVRLDGLGASRLAHGVVSADGSAAVFAHAQLSRPDSTVPPRLRLAGLDPDVEYAVEDIGRPGEGRGLAMSEPSWLRTGTKASGRALMTTGLQLPVQFPESVLLFALTATAH
jgi:alpha-galactosidase